MKNKPCSFHTHPTKVLKSPTPVWGGPSRCTPPRQSVILDLVGDFIPPVRTYGIKVKLTRDNPIIHVDWRDFYIPNLDVVDWSEISSAILKSQRSLFICCMQGHGRTGTALSILARMWGQVKKDENPIEWVRQRYCEKAVESRDQIEYVADILGDDSIAKTAASTLPAITYLSSNTYDDWGTGYNLGHGAPLTKSVGGVSTSQICLSYRQPGAMEMCVNADGRQSAVGHSCRLPYMHEGDHVCNYCLLHWNKPTCTVRNFDHVEGCVCDCKLGTGHSGMHVCSTCREAWA